MMKRSCCMYISAFVFIACICVREAECQECKDGENWCSAMQKYCHTVQMVRTICPKTCNACKPEECQKCEQNCTLRADGKYECVCLEGYRLRSDGETCEDIDECSQSKYLCPRSHQSCRNFPGGYECLQDKCLLFHQKGYIKSYSYEGRCCKKSTGTCGRNVQNSGYVKLIGGPSDTDLGMWPWHAHILLGKYVCGGALINKLWIVSAAHCLSSVADVKKDKLEVRLGMTDIKRTDPPHVQLRYIAEIIIHEKYEFPANDIALAKVNRPYIESDFVRPVCLPQGEVPPAGTKCVGTGFVKSGESFEQRLLKSDFTIAESRVCKKEIDFTWRTTVERIICGRTESCQDESSGPLVCQRCDSCDWFLTGFTSFRKKCDGSPTHIAYTNIEYYEKWIESNIAEVKVEKKNCTQTEWAQWGDWETCSESCGGGKQTRSRSCLNGKVGHPGCLGDQQEVRACDEAVPCPEWEA